MTDAYSRKIAGWSLSNTLEAKNAVLTLHLALSHLPANIKDLIHYSDRGIQYCCTKYVNCLQEHKINIIMTEKSDLY